MRRDRLDLALKRQAVSCLARREHSLQELRTKLRHWAGRRMAAAAAGEASAGPAMPDANAEPPADLDRLIEKVLDELQQQGLLSDARFVSSRLHQREGRFGNRRIEGELRQHGIRLDAGTRAALQQSEAQRARQVLSRRFDAPPADAAALARQRRFLAARGFGAEAIQAALKAATAAGALARDHDDDGSPASSGDFADD